jgi:hypothetical protein
MTTCASARLVAAKKDPAAESRHGELERHDIRGLGNREVASFEFAEVDLNLLDVEVCVILASRLEGPPKSLVTYPEAQDEIPVHALMPSHLNPPSKSLRRKGLNTIDANPTRCHNWHQIGINFGVGFSQRQEIKRFGCWGDRTAIELFLGGLLESPRYLRNI